MLDLICRQKHWGWERRRGGHAPSVIRGLNWAIPRHFLTPRIRVWRRARQHWFSLSNVLRGPLSTLNPYMNGRFQEDNSETRNVPSWKSLSEGDYNVPERRYLPSETRCKSIRCHAPCSSYSCSVISLPREPWHADEYVSSYRYRCCVFNIPILTVGQKQLNSLAARISALTRPSQDCDCPSKITAEQLTTNQAGFGESDLAPAWETTQRPCRPNQTLESTWGRETLNLGLLLSILNQKQSGRNSKAAEWEKSNILRPVSSAQTPSYLMINGTDLEVGFAGWNPNSKNHVWVWRQEGRGVLALWSN